MGDQPVQKAEARETKSGDLLTDNYFGPYAPGDSRDTGADRHGHVTVDDKGNPTHPQGGRDVGQPSNKNK